MKIQENVSLASYTTLKVGGPARYFVEVSTVEELEAARQFAKQTSVPLLVIGGGSNILVTEKGFDGVVVLNQIKGRSYAELEDGSVLATFGAGELLDEIVAETVEKGYWGLENLSHIPGTIGATPVQNVGAYGVEVSNLITEVAVLVNGEHKIFTAEECRFGYRDSIFKQEKEKGFVIISVTFCLSRTPNPQLSYKDLLPLAQIDSVTQNAIREQVMAIRNEKFPDWHTVGTAGSFFKNPIIAAELADQLQQRYPELPMYPVDSGKVKVSLGYILDKVCNLKGFKELGVGLYDKQALVLVNYNGDSHSVITFAEKVSEIVKEKTGITIEQEVTTV